MRISPTTAAAIYLTDKLTDTTSTSLPYSTNGQTRTWTYTYNRTGQVLTAQLPRTDVTAKTTYGYTGGTRAAPVPSPTRFRTSRTSRRRRRADARRRCKDPNSVLTTFAYSTVREWPTSSVVATIGRKPHHQLHL